MEHSFQTMQSLKGWVYPLVQKREQTLFHIVIYLQTISLCSFWGFTRSLQFL